MCLKSRIRIPCSAYPAARDRGHNLRWASGDRSHGRLGAVSFIDRFGTFLNQHVHYHGWGIDWVLEPLDDATGLSEAVRFQPAAALTQEIIAAFTAQVRNRGVGEFNVRSIGFTRRSRPRGR
jgi:hypothetical protein